MKASGILVGPKLECLETDLEATWHMMASKTSAEVTHVAVVVSQGENMVIEQESSRNDKGELVAPETARCVCYLDGLEQSEEFSMGMGRRV